MKRCTYGGEKTQAAAEIGAANEAMHLPAAEAENKMSLTVRKHRQLRSDLVESAWTARRTDPAMALYYNEQIKRKESKVVIIKIARKLLNRIRYVLVNQQPYEMGIVK
jgi:transposase